MRILQALGAALLASIGSLTSVTAAADTYPGKPVRIVIPYAPGGGADALARQLGLALGKELGQPFVIDSKPGANTAIAASFVAKAPADGYTLLLTGNATTSLNPLLVERMPYDPGKTAVIVGTGVIATALASRCQAFGMRTVGVSATPRPLAHFDAVVARTALQQAAAEADHRIALVPLDESTRGIISAQVLQAQRPHAFFINVARGGVCDEDALLHQLERGALAGAALDVFSTEPLPPGHPLRKAPRLRITPHLGGESEHYLERVRPIIEHNLRCMEAGRPGQMWNLVGPPDRPHGHHGAA